MLYGKLADLFYNAAVELQKIGAETKPDTAIKKPEPGEIETMAPEYFNQDFKEKVNLPTIYRFNQSGMRYYFTVIDDNVTFYPSVTTIIEKTTEMSYGLKKLIAEKGLEEYYAYMKQKAYYGTLLHIFIADYLRNGKVFDTDSIRARVTEYADENNIKFDTDYWPFNLNKDLRSLVQFINDYEVEPIAIETVGYYNKDGYRFAGAIDLICEMNYTEKGYFGEVYKTGERKGEPKETSITKRGLAIVDFKSGKSGFFDDHAIQLHMYKTMAEFSMNIKVDKVFNVAPKDWEKNTPTYSLADQTDNPLSLKIPFLLGSFACEWKEPKDILIMNGKLNGGNMQDCTKLINAKDYVLAKLGIQPREKTTTKQAKEFLQTLNL